MNLIELRKKTGLTQVKFAEKFHIPLSTYTHWEQGRFTPPNYVVEMIAQLVDHELEFNNLLSQKANCETEMCKTHIAMDWIENQIDNLSVRQHRQMHQGEEDEEINAIGRFMRGMLEEWQENCQKK